MVNTITSKKMVFKERFKQRIVICGSMSFYGDMLEIQSMLKEKSILSMVPEAEDQYVAALSEENFTAFKRRVSFQYLRTIRAPETVAILAVNVDKHGISGYIGPNTFAEIAVAFAQQKKIFLLQGIPHDYFEELEAWGVISLDGSLSGIFQYYKAATQSSLMQLELFEDS